MTPELTALLCVALVAGLAWDIARKMIQRGDRELFVPRSEYTCHTHIDMTALRERFDKHDKLHAELLASWQQTIEQLERRVNDVTEKARTETAGTLAAAAEGMQRKGSGWR